MKREVDPNDPIILTDRVAYQGLTPGKTYKVVGTLYDKATGQPLMENGAVVTAAAEFTPEEPDGYVDVTFTISAGAIGGKTVVAFEQLYNGIGADAVVIATHEDIEDEDQTVKVPDNPPFTPVLGLKSHTWFNILMLMMAAVLLLAVALFLMKRRTPVLTAPYQATQYVSDQTTKEDGSQSVSGNRRIPGETQDKKISQDLKT